MASIVEKVLILSFVLHCSVVFCDDVKDESLDRVGLWFGPRLGKRTVRPNVDNRQTLYKLLEAAEVMKYYYDQLPYYESSVDEPEREKKKSKVIFTPILGRSLSDYEKRSENMDFTPRLGRRLSDDMPATPPEQEVYHADSMDQMDGRPKYFSPRLGRTMDFSPRLGRDMSSYGMFPNKLRMTRSANKTTKP